MMINKKQIMLIVVIIILILILVTLSGCTDLGHVWVPGEPGSPY